MIRVALGVVLGLSGGCGGSPEGDGGFGDASTTGASSAERAEFEAIAKRMAASTNPYFGRVPLESYRRRQPTAGDLPTDEAIRLELDLARAALRFGELEESEQAIERAFGRAEGDGVLDRYPEVLRERALLHLRMAEAENCVARHNRDCCLLPLADGGVHTVREPALEARRDYAELWAANPDDRGIRWLLNIAHMALGDWPAGVPEEARIPSEAFRSDHQIPRFRDVATELGVATFNLCGGVVVEDFDNDERLDIVTTTSDLSGPVTHYRNLGPDGFQDRSAASGLDAQLGGLNCIGADYDSDGDVDLLILRGGWMNAAGCIRNSLLRNDGSGHFEDVTRAAGLAEPAAPCQAAAFGDFDGDGDLDLFIGNESRAPAGRRGHHPSQLFRNDGKGRFTDVATDAGVVNEGYCKGVAAGDFDNDGDLDLYVSNLGRNRLYRNDGGLRFTDVAGPAGVSLPHRTFAPWFFDYDNDGWLDLFVTSYDASISDVAADYLGEDFDAHPPALFRNLGGTFENVAGAVGLTGAWSPMGANFGDLDGDGWLDIYLATGDPNFESLVPNVMLRNDAGRSFQDVTTAGGFGHLQKGHGVAFADLDNDGDQDLYHQLGGFYPADAFRNALYENPGHENRFVTVELVGRTSNRSGVGARLRVTIETPSGERTIHRAVGCVSSFGGSPLRQEVGLGDAQRILAIEVDWPDSDTHQRFSGVELDQAVRLTEGETTVETIELHSWTLGGS